MKKCLFSAFFICTASLLSASETVPAETVAKIEAFLASIECQMDPGDIEIEEDGFELDDVICKGGDQFDIALDKDLNEIGRRAE